MEQEREPSRRLTEEESGLDEHHGGQQEAAEEEGVEQARMIADGRRPSVVGVRLLGAIRSLPLDLPFALTRITRFVLVFAIRLLTPRFRRVFFGPARALCLLALGFPP